MFDKKGIIYYSVNSKSGKQWKIRKFCRANERVTERVPRAQRDS